MALVYGDRVKETTSTTGTGDITLSGAVTGFRTFDSVLNTNDTCYYCVTDDTDWEVGLGTFTSPSTLARTTLIASSTGSKINWSSGSKNIFITQPASKISDTSHTHTESQITDLGSYITASSTDTLTNKTINSASNTITITESNISDLQTYLTAADINTLAELNAIVTDATLVDSTHTHTESDITDLGSYITDISGSPLSQLSDVTITTIASGELLKWNGSAWINNTLAEAGIQAVLAEGAFADGDKTKLDGIETGADVTDTANVTAAGALMDSEVTNLAQVKAFNSADYATASHTHTESEITDLDHDATKIQGVTVDNTDIANGKILQYNSTSGNLEYEALAGGGDMSTATYDPASVSEQLVGLTATQTLTNKTLSTGSTIDANVTVTEVLKKVYPVGAIFLSGVATNPNTLLGFGTWSQIEGKFIAGVSTTDGDFDLDDTGGAKDVTLTLSQIPSHSHTIEHTAGGSGGASGLLRDTTATGSSINKTYSGSEGGDGSHENLPPYIAKYIWQRTA